MDVKTRLVIDGVTYEYVEGICGEGENPCSMCALKDICDDFSLEEDQTPCGYIGLIGDDTGCFMKAKDTDPQPATATEHDAVNHPHHYTSHPSGVECIQITRHYCFAIGNAIKYLWRAGLKQDVGTPPKEKEIQDLEKAIWYINDRIKQLKNED